MGSELVTLPENKKRLSMSEIFWEAYPAYLTMGMSSDEYWNGDARACRAYRKKWDEAKKLRDEELWRQGAYIYQALICVAPAFNSIKPRQPENYMAKPFLQKQTEIAETEIQTGTKNKRDNFKALVTVWATNVNKRRSQQNGDRT